MMPNVAIDGSGNVNNCTTISKIDHKVLIYIYNHCCNSVFLTSEDEFKTVIWDKYRNKGCIHYSTLVCNLTGHTPGLQPAQ